MIENDLHFLRSRIWVIILQMPQKILFRWQYLKMSLAWDNRGMKKHIRQMWDLKKCESFCITSLILRMTLVSDRTLELAWYSYLRTTMIPSKTLKPFEMYPKGPSAMILSSISTAKIPEKTTLLISTITVNSGGYHWKVRKNNINTRDLQDGSIHKLKGYSIL